MTNANVTWVEDMMFVAQGDSGHAVVMDAGESAGGHDLGSRPMEVLLMGLLGCTSMDVISILKKKRQPVEGLKVFATGDRNSEKPDVFHAHPPGVCRLWQGGRAGVGPRGGTLETKYCGASASLRGVAKITTSIRIEPGPVAAAVGEERLPRKEGDDAVRHTSAQTRDRCPRAGAPATLAGLPHPPGPDRDCGPGRHLGRGDAARAATRRTDNPGAPADKGLTGWLAPDFTLPTAGWRTVQLNDLRAGRPAQLLGNLVPAVQGRDARPECPARRASGRARLHGRRREYAEETAEQVNAFAQPRQLAFPLALDTTGQISSGLFAVRGLPVTYIIDRDGFVRDMWQGQISRAAMLARLEEVW